MLSYSGWNMYGMLAIVTRSHGINVLLNLFFGPVVNAARSIAYQILNALNQFITNFFTAVRPQITKSYAAGETNQMLSLLYQSSKFSYYLVLILAIPILLETPSILQLWLGEIPDYAILFSRLVVINALIDSLRLPVMASVQATGKVKYFELISGTITLLNLPVSYLFLKLEYPPQTTMYISIVFSLIAQIARVIIAQKQISLSLKKYLFTVIAPIIGVTLAAALLPMLFCLKLDASIHRMIFTTLLSFCASAIAIWLLGLTKNERKVIQEKIGHFILKRKS
jgi:O-antigen/teichoic acid export membrane protein